MQYESIFTWSIQMELGIISILNSIQYIDHELYTLAHSFKQL